jgi:hypothetical protein
MPAPQLISAQVILQASTSSDLKTPITSANLKHFAPPSEQSAYAKAAFAKLGFTVGNVVGNSFSITAKPKIFEKTFGVGYSATDEAPIDNLAEPLRKTVRAVVFPPPPEFGPGNY